MKVLFTSTPGLGHVLPMLPLVREMRARAHEVRWLGGHALRDDLRRIGVEVVEAGLPERTRMAQLASRYPEVSSVPPRERQRAAFPKVFAELAAPAMIEPVRAEVERWSPELLVHEAAELAGPLVAAEAAIPSVSHGFGQLVPAPAMQAAGDVLASAWRAAGLEPDGWAGSYRGLYVDIYPPSLSSADAGHVPDVQRCRPADGVAASGGLVYVSFGTLFNRPELLRTAALAAADVADEVLVTVGADFDPAALGPMPAHVRVQGFVSQAQVMPRCAAVVSHGGSGTLLAALAHGVPVVCVPQAADQFVNAENVARLGAGAALSGAAVDPAVLRAAIEHVVRSPAPRAVAAELATEIAAMPSVAEVADRLEQLVPGVRGR